MGKPRWEPPDRGNPHGRWLVEFHRPVRKVRRFPAKEPTEKGRETARRAAQRYADDTEKGLATTEMLERLGLVLPAAPPPPKAAPWFSDFAASFLRWLQASEAAPLTLIGYRSQIGSLLEPTFHSLRIDQITPAMVDVLRSELKTEGRSVHAPLDCLSSMMSWAVEEGLLERNPCQRPRRRYRAARSQPRPEPRHHTPEQCKALLDAVPAEMLRVRCAIILAGWVGLRRGELLGLGHEDVDETQLVIHVRRQVNPWIGRSIARERPPKYNSMRDVPIGERVLRELRPLLERARRLRLRYLLADDRGRIPQWRRLPGGKRTKLRKDGKPIEHRGDELQRWLAHASAKAGISPPATLRTLRASAYTRWVVRFGALEAESWSGHQLGGGRAAAVPMGEIGARHYWGGIDLGTIDRGRLN